MKKDSFGAVIKLLDEAVMKNADASEEVQKVLEKFYIAEVTKLVLEASKKDWWPNAAEYIAFLLYCKSLERVINEKGKTITTGVANNFELQAEREELKKELISLKAQYAVDVRHSQHGGSRDKRKNICAIWASGKYSSRDLCAKQECAALGMSFSVARKALRNTPNPA